mmetsp:Transcript_172/g.263  ORF Transcript_172/g.263 Transcript_172/m.263 type:complete len:135 (-) Transcript_172:159-563(-)|eukprot:CAMPEP_0178442128 /NCGR_PEP_ID=MMETSP0689_2-20121128/37963_1 /TAXON_ID=160604 /ORGANISM="Amphidinium massartii, Strain CS-259" /LENGTH=134 /DNA_ID=CAMNT_0020065581 /DNA_START=51 /DNA_END=455 /DNA_ORIENTATION=+
MVTKTRSGKTTGASSAVISSAYDLNKDGRVLRSEVKAVEAAAAAEKERARKAFKSRTGISKSKIIDSMYDINHDGRVLRSEVRRIKEATAKAKALAAEKSTARAKPGAKAKGKVEVRVRLTSKKPASASLPIRR